jgi:superfamily I DNA/RNA helicase
MSHTPTPEQAAIIAAGIESRDNLLIVARAGAAKTSTLVMIAEALPKTPILSLAFNVAIKKEMQARLPQNCEAKTLNGLGHSAFARFLGRRLELDDDKLYKALKAEVNDLPQADKDVAYGRMAQILKMARDAKQAGYVPAKLHSQLRPLLESEEFFGGLDEEPTALEEQLVNRILTVSFKQALGGRIDFNDQVLLPAVMPVQFDSPELTLVDEAQDLSPINHVLLRKLVKNKRIIAVGDPCQAIYGFRGAANNSMDLLAQQFSMREMYLTISFRCPQEIIKAAWWRAPDMRWPDWAKPGAVRTLTRWSLDEVPDGAAIICRNNAPIISLAFMFLRAGRYPELPGNDIVKGLVKLLRGFGKNDMTAEQLHSEIDVWAAQQERRTRALKTLHDRVESLHIIAEQGDTLGDAIIWAETLQNSAGRIKLMTGHKSKGLEFPEVFFLDQQLLSTEGQDPNVKYVIQTRAQERLTYIYSGGLV